MSVSRWRGAWHRLRSGPGAKVALVGGLTLVALGLRAVGLSHGLPALFHDDTPKQLHRVAAFSAG